MTPRRFTKALLLAGLSAFPAFHLVVALAVARNSWWSFWEHAFSDLGGPRAADPWVYNYGLVLLGVLLALFSLGLLSASRSNGAAFASGLYFTAGIFLALIGIYPSGTRPHTFVSTWFYAQSFLATLALGLALLHEKRRLPGAVLLLLSLSPAPLAYLVEVLVGWPSVAAIEYFGAAFIAAAAAVAVAAHWH
uniref:DUF998 domain-containing protein n=1 Tax=Thermofilum pendens TaxID=2269 RepID=A0A7C4FFB8_THEPE